MEFRVKVGGKKKTRKGEGTSPATLSAWNRTEPHSGFCANKKINYSYKFLWRAEEDQPLGDQEPPQQQWGGKVAGPAGCWEGQGASQELPWARGDWGAGKGNGVHAPVTLASSQDSAASSAGCESLTDLTHFTGHWPVLWLEISFWPKEKEKSILKNAPIKPIICVFSFYYWKYLYYSSLVF